MPGFIRIILIQLSYAVRCNESKKIKNKSYPNPRTPPVSETKRRKCHRGIKFRGTVRQPEEGGALSFIGGARVEGVEELVIGWPRIEGETRNVIG